MFDPSQGYLLRCCRLRFRERCCRHRPPIPVCSNRFAAEVVHSRNAWSDPLNCGDDHRISDAVRLADGVF